MGTREDSKAETREALLVAGLAEIAERGLDAPSLDSICARAGFTRGAFYVHFRDRDDFLVAVMERFLVAFLNAVIARGDEARDLEETITRFAGVLGLGLERAVPFHRLLEVCSRVPDLGERFAKLLDEAGRRVAGAAAEGQRAGTVRGDLDPAATGQLLLALALGAITALDAGLEVDVAGVRDAVLRLLGSEEPGSEKPGGEGL
jgi:AcrR family transcriptional regulator